MPLIVMDGARAVATRKANPVATWGDRETGNRCEPIATPAFEVPFKLAKGDHIFTVGSCFARNVEAELLRRGYDLPARRILERPEFTDAAPDLLNNYATPSIYNEFAWAFGEAPFDMAAHIIDLGGDRCIDMHVATRGRAAPRALVEARRRAILESYRSAADCRLIIMTLGLAEVWFDRQLGVYLNRAPFHQQIRAAPDRFQLHVLGYQEIHDQLDRTMQLLRRHCRADMRLLLTISPVPLQETHRDQDVMVANTYSKSVQRAAAEAIVLAHPFVSYFPSYESVVHSDRQIAWANDLIHVTRTVVEENVRRMVEAFASHNVSSETMAVVTTPAEALAEARRLKAEGSSKALAVFFARHAAISAKHLPFALEHARHLLETGAPAEALALADAVPGAPRHVGRAVVCAQALIALERPADAYDRLLALSEPAELLSPGGWRLLLESALATGDRDRIATAVLRWSHARPLEQALPHSLVGRWHRQAGRLTDACSHFETAYGHTPDDEKARLELAQVYIALGRRADAEALFVGGALATGRLGHQIAAVKAMVTRPAGQLKAASPASGAGRFSRLWRNR